LRFQELSAQAEATATTTSRIEKNDLFIKSLWFPTQLKHRTTKRRKIKEKIKVKRIDLNEVTLEICAICNVPLKRKCRRKHE